MDELELYIYTPGSRLSDKVPETELYHKIQLVQLYVGFLVEKLNGNVFFDNKGKCHVIHNVTIKVISVLTIYINSALGTSSVIILNPTSSVGLYHCGSRSSLIIKPHKAAQ